MTGNGVAALLSNCEPEDVLLVEQVDGPSRLNAADWSRLRAEISAKQVRVVALDIPTSHQLVQTGGVDFTARMLDAINRMMLDMLAAIALKDYEDTRETAGRHQEPTHFLAAIAISARLSRAPMRDSG